jgi:putative endopeptidase
MRRFSLLFLLFLFSLSALAQQSKQRGVYVEDLNPDVAPCADFFEYSNGRWREQNPIPPTMVRWSRRWEAGEVAKEHLRGILDEVSARRDWPRASVEQLIGDHYASCMDEERIEKLGLAPLEPLLKEIDAIQDAAGREAMLARLHQMGINAPFGLRGFSDNHDPNDVVAHLFASGLGMPDRDYYLLPAERFQEAREKYRTHVASMFRLAGSGDEEATAASATVFAMETALAQSALDRVSLRNPRNTDNKMTFAQLEQLTPSFAWAAYFDRGGRRWTANSRRPRWPTGRPTSSGTCCGPAPSRSLAPSLRRPLSSANATWAAPRR